MFHPHHRVDDTKRIRLTITEKCNLQCIYCFEKHKNYKSIALDTAKKLIYDEMMKDDGYAVTVIDLFGGEPFLEFDLIKQLCEWAWAQDWNEKECLFWTTTNGTLVHGDIKKWLKKNCSRITCDLSLDGIKEAHDINRSSSFDSIDATFFAETWPGRQVRAVISEQSLPYMYESVVYLNELFEKVNIRLAFGCKWDKLREELDQQLNLLLSYYRENPNIRLCSMLDIDFRELLSVQQHKRCCGAGYNQCAYDIDGNKYPCAQFQDICRSKKIPVEEIWKLDFSSRNDYLAEVCRSCRLLNICQTCFASCYTNPGNTEDDCDTLFLIVGKAAIIQKERLDMSKGINKDKQYDELLKEIIYRYKTKNWIVG